MLPHVHVQWLHVLLNYCTLTVLQDDYASVGGAPRRTVVVACVCLCVCVCMSFARISLQRLKTRR